MVTYWEEFEGERNRQIAKHRSQRASKKRGGKKCRDCGLYGCVCQMTLPDWEEEESIKKEDWLQKCARVKKKLEFERRLKD